MKPKLFLICGLPGSGKSTMARKLAQEHKAVRIETDEWVWALDNNLRAPELRSKLERQLNKFAMRLLDVGQSVVLEHGFWAKKERDELRIEGQNHNSDVYLVYLDVDIETLWRRLRERNTSKEWEGTNFTRVELECWSDSFERPTKEELDKFAELKF